MKASIFIHLVSGFYCGCLIALNWFWSVNYSRSVGITSEIVTPVTLAYLFSLVVALYLAFRCVRLAARRLEAGERVRTGRWITAWGVLFYTLPLLFRRSSTSTWIEGDRALATATTGYGNELSSSIFLLAVIGLLLFQVLLRLRDQGPGPAGEIAPLLPAGSRA